MDDKPHRIESYPQIDDIGAVVVHHNSLSTIGSTIDHITADGVLPDNIVVVDNSEPSGNELSAIVDPRVKIRSTKNDGYGAAVNAGVAELNSFKQFRYILISTHESTPDPGTIRALRDVLSSNPNAAVAGPLLTTNGGTTVWSSGGYFTRWLNLPRHIGHNKRVAELDEVRGIAKVGWIDGAFMLYRAAAITELPMDEGFFLYMEEADHHVRIRAQGWDIICVRSVAVGQTSNGIPDYYLGRNMYRFQKRAGTRFSATFAAPAEIARRAITHLIKGAPKPSTRSALRGWLNGIAGGPAQAVRSASIVNPIAAALAHYTLELSDVLKGAGYQVIHLNLTEPSMASHGRIGWLARHIANLIRARLVTSGPIIVAWAPLGLLDLTITRLLCGNRASVVLHDPVPLVRSIGYGDIASLIATRLPRCAAIAHSSLADYELKRRGIDAVLLPHPAVVADPIPAHTPTGNRPVVLVFGQYKPDRDIDLMAKVAAKIGTRFLFRVVGRGWPHIPGWESDSRFIEESEISELLLESNVILIPYRRFFQSGVAIRCLELGRPFVGPRGTSLTELLGDDSRLLATETTVNWIAAIEYAIEYGDHEVLEARARYASRVEDAWGKFLYDTH